MKKRAIKIAMLNCLVLTSCVSATPKGLPTKNEDIRVTWCINSANEICEDCFDYKKFSEIEWAKMFNTKEMEIIEDWKPSHIHYNTSYPKELKEEIENERK